jgi:hypothetical protein
MVSQLLPPPAFPGAAAPWPPEKGFPNWSTLIANAQAVWDKAATGAAGPKVLIASNTGMHGAVSNLDSVLAAALTLRGAQVSRAFCDGILQGCLIPTFGDATPPEMIAERGLVQRLCKACFNRGTHTHRPSGLGEHRLSRYLTAQDYAEVEALVAALDVDAIPGWTLDGMAIGEHAYAGALRYYAKGKLDGEPLGEAVLRRYLEGAILTARAYDRLLAEEQPEVVVLHHGIYSPQGVAAEVCHKRGIRVVTWVVAYRKNCFIFSHDDTYHHTLMTEPTELWSQIELSAAQRETVTSYLASRADGRMDWIYFHKEGGDDFADFAKAKGIDLSKPVVAVLTNVMWDAQLHYPANAFASMKDWIVETIGYFIERTDLEVVVRIHPAEVRGAIKSRQLVQDVLLDAFPDLPRHIHIIAPDEEASTYALAGVANAVVIYGTKMGVELTPLGKPVIVAGEAWIRNKGVTQDARDKPHYFSLLEQLPLAPGQAEPDRERALRYAYHFFFRRMIPLPFLEPNGTGAMFDVAVESVADLAPGKWTGLDVIVDGIVEARPFIHQSELIAD